MYERVYSVSRVAIAMGMIAFILPLATMPLLTTLGSPAPLMETGLSAWFNWYVGSRTYVFASAFVNLATWLLSLWFIQTQYRFWRLHSPTQHSVALVATVGGLSFAITGIISDLIQIATALQVSSVREATTNQQLQTLINMDHAAGAFGSSSIMLLAVATFLLGGGLIMMRSSSRVRWAGWIGILLGILAIVLAGAGLFLPPVGAYKASPLTPLISILFFFWNLVSSIILIFQTRGKVRTALSTQA